MGTPYSRSVTQWSNGQYPDANNTAEDDLAAIGARGGFRPDDHADTPAGATAVTAGDHAGLVGVGGDVDVFRYTPTGNATRVDVSTPPPGNNLLARLIVRDAAGDVVAEVEPSVASGWSLTADVPAGAGAFTVEVAPSSWLTPATGFVTYGSLGHYTISFTDIPGPTTTTARPLHDHLDHDPHDHHLDLDHHHHHDGSDNDDDLHDHSTTTTTATPTTTTTTTTTTDDDHDDCDHHHDHHDTAPPRPPHHHDDRAHHDVAAHRPRRRPPPRRPPRTHRRRRHRSRTGWR